MNLPKIINCNYIADRKNTSFGFSSFHDKKYIENVEFTPTTMRGFFRKFERAQLIRL